MDATTVHTVHNTDELITNAMQKATKLWNSLKYKLHDPAFQKLSDQEKMAIYNNKKSEFSGFCIDYPIVSKYMIVMNSFNENVFHKFLLLFYKTTENNRSEKTWIELQATYIKWLWLSLNTKNGTHNVEIAKKIYQQAYKVIETEFKDFKKNYKEIEDVVKQTKKVHSGEITGELLDRLSNSNQKLDPNDLSSLKEILQLTLVKKYHKQIMTELLQTVSRTGVRKN